MPAGRRWRHIFWRLLPRYLTNLDGGIVRYALMMSHDAFSERAFQGLNARFPRCLDPEALALQGQDRGIIRGRDEPLARYAVRLRKWRAARKRQGGAWALLEQVQEYFREADGTRWRVYAIDANGAKWEIGTDGAQSVSYGNAWNWDGEAIAETNWARWWLVIIPRAGQITATPDFGDPTLYGGGLYSDAYAVGHEGVTARDAKAVRAIVERWTSPARPEMAIVSLTGADPVPDGTWEDFGQVFGGVLVPRTDRPFHRFWFLHPDVRAYAGDPVAGGARLAASTDYSPPGGTPYSPTAVWHAVVRLPGGGAVAGTAARGWPLTVNRVDDGDVPV